MVKGKLTKRHNTVFELLQYLKYCMRRSTFWTETRQKLQQTIERITSAYEYIFVVVLVKSYSAVTQLCLHEQFDCHFASEADSKLCCMTVWMAKATLWLLSNEAPVSTCLSSYVHACVYQKQDIMLSDFFVWWLHILF